MRFKAVRKMSKYDLYHLCNRENYFTRGDNAEYEELLSIPDREIKHYGRITMSGYRMMAESIFEHSDVETKKIRYGCSDDELMADILFKLYNDASVTIIEMKED